MKHVNKSQFKYYLDTNAIRKLSSSLDQYARNGAYASIWTLSELLGHIIHKPQDYHKYCVIIDNLFKSNVPIVKTWPADRLYESYGLESPVLFDSITNDIVFMCKCLKQYNSCEDWRNHISKYNIGNSWQFIVELDSLTSYLKDSLQKYWKIEKTTETIKEYIKFHQNTKREIIKQRLVSYYAGCIINRCPDVCKMGILMGMTESRFKRFLSACYDNSIDIWLFVSSFYADRKICYKENPRRNDDNDLFHLLYLQDGSIMVTDDIKLKSLINSLFPNRAIFVEDFKNMGR